MGLSTGLENVNVLVTGASGGIGLNTVLAFLNEGANVYAHYNSNLSTLDALKLSRPADIYRLHAVKADLSSERSVKNLFEDIGNTNTISVIVVNHGIWPSDDIPLVSMSLDQWNNTISTNLTSSFLVIREYLRRLSGSNVPEGVRDKASVILIGSTAGKYGEAGHVDYACSKSAMMNGLLLSLKNEIVNIAPKGRVNCVSPGWVRTPMAESALADPNRVYRALATTPLKKVASPKDIASQIVVLASPILSGHVTGQNIMVEGGMEGRLLNLPQDIDISKARGD